MAITEKYVNNAGAGAHDGSSDANAFSWAEMVTDINAGGKAGNRYNVKQDGTYARTTTNDTISGDGTSTSPIIIRGYKTTITDGFQGRTSGNGALVTTNFPVLTWTTGRLGASGGNWLIFECLSITGASSGSSLFMGSDSVVKSCVIVNSSTNAAAIGIQASAQAVIFDNDVSLTGGSGANAAIVVGNHSRILANRITGGPNAGITIGAFSGWGIIDNLIFASVGKQVVTTNINAVGIIYGNTIVGGSGDGIEIFTGSTTLHCIVNNMITDNGAYGIDGVSAANAIFAAYNRTRDNTSGADNLATDWLSATKYGQVTTDTGGAETDYTNAGSRDYTLVSGSPGKAAGNWAYRDIGALQRAEAGGGGLGDRIISAAGGLIMAGK